MKKHIIFLFIVIVMPIVCLAQHSFSTLQLNGQNITSGTQNFNNGTEIEAPSMPSATDNISNTANVTYTSGTEIELRDGFTAGSFSGGGVFTAQIANTSNDINAVIESPPSLGSYTYERFEFGVSIPSSYVTQIDNFLQTPSWPTTISNTIDPYDPAQIKIVATISQGSFSVTRYGFFYQNVWVDNNTGLFEAPFDDQYPFRIRFAPPYTGKWNIAINVYVNGNQIGTTFYGIFGVETDYGNPGNLSVGNYEHLKFDNGNSFFGIGQNIAIALASGPNGQPLDNDYYNQRTYMTDLANNGGNFVRLRVDPWSNGLEWGTSVPCNYHQAQALELDQTLGTCEYENVYMMITLLNDQALSLYNGYGGSFTWDATGAYANPYYYLLGSNNSSQTFFTDSYANQAFENYLFYVVARWGYSPNIAMWELINETDALGKYSHNGALYTDLSAYRGGVGGWTSAMVNYLKSSDLYPNHLVTTGYTSGGAKTPDNSNDYLDVWEDHHYNDAEDANKVRFNALPLNNIPHFFGELGPNQQDCNISSCCNSGPEGSSPESGEDLSFHNAVWATAFMNCLSVGLNWFDWSENCNSSPPTPHRAYNFPFLKSFFANIDLKDNCYTPDYDEFTDDGNAIEMFSMENCSGSYDTYKIGWFHNESMDWEHSGEPCLSPPSCGYATYIGAGDPSITFGNLVPESNYEFTVYNPYTGDQVGFTPFSTPPGFDISASFNIALSNETYYLTDANIEPDYAFTLYYTGSSHSPQKGDSNILTNVLPNDTVYLPMDSIRFPLCYQGNKKGHNAWNFDNGESSNESNPKFIFNRPDNYLVTLLHSDSANKPEIKIKQTYVAIEINHKVEQLDSADVRIVPDPTTGIFTIFSDKDNPIKKIAISDILNNVVFSVDNPKENQFNISNLANGIYLVKIESNRNIYYRKVVKCQIQ